MILLAAGVAVQIEFQPILSLQSASTTYQAIVIRLLWEFNSEARLSSTSGLFASGVPHEPWLYIIVVNVRSCVQAVKQVRAEHRLILSGTPIQNNVQELWALFDFLMPGFLGTETAFYSRYGKAFASGKTAKSGSADSQKALLAMDALHKQVFNSCYIYDPGSEIAIALREQICQSRQFQIEISYQICASNAGGTLHTEAYKGYGTQRPSAKDHSGHILQSVANAKCHVWGVPWIRYI